MLIGIFYLQIVESSSLVSILFREVFSHPYISFFHLLVNGFSVIRYSDDSNVEHIKLYFSEINCLENVTYPTSIYYLERDEYINHSLVSIISLMSNSEPNIYDL